MKEDALTLRDYFATAALTGLLAAEQDMPSLGEAELWAPRRAYEIADAMLAERSK